VQGGIGRCNFDVKYHDLAAAELSDGIDEVLGLRLRVLARVAEVVRASATTWWAPNTRIRHKGFMHKKKKYGTHLKPMPASRMPCQLGANVWQVNVTPSVAFVKAKEAPAAFTAAQSTPPW
jgi:hypothetical protein